LAIEDPRRRDVNSAIAGTIHSGDDWPDLLAQIGASGAWGRAQIAVAVRDASIVTGPLTTASKVGYAASVGGLFNVPGMPGDTFGFQVSYGKGATAYVVQNIDNTGGIFHMGKGSKDAQGLFADGVFAGGVYNLATAWGFEAGYEHAWSNTLKTSLAGGYVSLTYPFTGGLCGAICDTSLWNIGSRTTWTPVQNLQLGVDIMYTHINDFAAPGVPVYAGKVRGDVNVWTGMVRVQHAFWP
jgi:hypothetical protein